jgi:hypothetical protein
MAGHKLNASRQLTLLAPTVITTAVTGVVGVTIAELAAMESLTAEAVFTYGSGGTSLTAYIQTSFTGGLTWTDIMAFQFTTATARKVSSVRTAAVVAAAVTPGDGALTANTVVDGLLGDQLRVKYTSVGTYASGTTIAIYSISKG